MTTSGWFPLFRSVLDSSINDEDITTRWVWITMLARANRRGQLQATPQAIGRMANVGYEGAQAALKALGGADPLSTTKAEEGRRIIEISPNLWQLVNYEHYREMATKARAREMDAERARRYRDRKDRHGDVTDSTDSNGASRPVTDGNETVMKSALGVGNRVLGSKKKGSEEGKKRAPAKRFKKPTVEEVAAYLVEKGETRFTAAEFVDANIAKGWLVGKTKTPMKDWRGSVRTWIHNRNRKGEPQRGGTGPKPQVGDEDYYGDAAWMYGTFRKADRDNFGNHSMWDEYADEAAEHPPETAPKFEEWLQGQVGD